MALAGQVAIITGSSSGIGRSIALRLARDGADVVVHYRKEVDEANAVRAEIIAMGRLAIAVQADVAKVEEVRRLVEEAVGHLGRLDIMVNNAGIEIKEPFLEVTEENYDRVLAVNLKGTFFGAQAAAQQMVRQGGGGRIVNVSSIHEDQAMPGNSSYCASKGGVRMIMRTICVELASHGITVNNIAPGAIATPINQTTLQSPDLMKELVASIPLRRLGTPDEVADLAAYLVSPEASYITGSTYVMDGGMMRQAVGL